MIPRSACAAAGLLMALAACSQLPPRDPGAAETGGPTPLENLARSAALAEESRRGLEPLSRFLGEWEGTSESAQGNLRLRRRMSWIVTGSWLVEQTAVQDPERPGRILRSGALYRWDPVWRMIVATSFGPAGTASERWMRLASDGQSLEILPQPEARPESLFQVTLFNGREWRARVYDLDASGNWQEVERLQLRRAGEEAAEEEG